METIVGKSFSNVKRYCKNFSGVHNRGMNRANRMTVKQAMRLLRADTEDRFMEILNVSRQLLRYWKLKGIPSWRVEIITEAAHARPRRK